jgi:hypothetical protein
MVDLNYLKQAYSEAPTDRLIEFLFVKPEDLIPDALSVIKEELEKRGVEINRLWEREILKSGSIESIINNAIDLNPKKKLRATGDLYLTSRGIFYIPIKYTNPALSMYFGLLGMVVDGVRNKLPAEEVDTLKDSKNIPVSLLARYVKDSYEENIENVQSVMYGKTGGVRTVNKDGEIREFGFDQKNVFMLETWINAHGIKHEVRERFLGLTYLT